jgi:hypothetical protein
MGERALSRGLAVNWRSNMQSSWFVASIVGLVVVPVVLGWETKRRWRNAPIVLERQKHVRRTRRPDSSPRR